jgi:hypothetical protein
MSIEQTIQILLDRKQKQQKLDTLLPILYRLSDDRFRPSPDDKIVNTELSDLKTVAEKRRRYNLGLEKQEMAMLPGGKTVLLGSDGAKFNNVDLLGGLWRVQEPFDARGFEVITIRDNKNEKDLMFVVLKQLDRQERTNFEFYSAASVNWGAFGLRSDFKPDFIIAKYDTNRGVFYSYRCKLTDPYALENARAHLAGKVLEAYQDLVENEIKQSRANLK